MQNLLSFTVHVISCYLSECTGDFLLAVTYKSNLKGSVKQSLFCYLFFFFLSKVCFGKLSNLLTISSICTCAVW